MYKHTDNQKHKTASSSNPRLIKQLFFTFILVGFLGCSPTANEIEEKTILSVTDEESAHYNLKFTEEVSPETADDLDISLWASEKLLADPVALHVDDYGRVLVTVTERRRSGEIDIRGHRDWMGESIAMESVEDKRDFLREKLSVNNRDKNSWLTDYIEGGNQTWEDLKRNKESVYRIEDLTGNGFANKSSRFIYDFNSEITDVAGAVLSHNGEVFLGVAPDLWRIRDTNNDGFADEKESISHGYGIHISFGGHGMSGLTVGPAGRIYWSIGDPGLNVTDEDNKNWYYPNEGAIVRSEPDGSNFEVFASGLRNTHEFAFDKFGNLITVDNDGDHAGEFERLVYLINGSDSGWRINWQFGKYTDPKNNDYKVWMDEDYFQPRFANQAAHILPPLSRFHSGPAGMTYNPGTALSEKWKDHFFVTEFPGNASQSSIHAFTLKQKGASFELDREEKIMQGILATGMDFGPDGALYFADWIDGWATKGKGRIWKMDSRNDAQSPIRNETKNLLAEEFVNRSSEDLIGLLKHEDMRVRKKAQFKLAERNDTEILFEALEQKSHQLARVHAIWGLAQIGRRNPSAVEPLIDFLNDEDSEIRAQSAKMLGDVRYEPSGDHLIPLLKDENDRVKLFTVEALGRLSYQPAFEPIVEMLQDNNDEEVYLRHAGAIALERLGDTEALTNLADHNSRAVKVAAVVALKRLQHPGIVQFLEDDDEYIVTNAARAINDDQFIKEALPHLARLLNQDQFTGEPLLRRAINANLFIGTKQAADRLAAFAIRNDVPEVLRVEALNTLSTWPDPTLMDRVTGMHRGDISNNPGDGLNAVKPILTTLLAGKEVEVKLAAIQTAGKLDHSGAIHEIFALMDSDPSDKIRIASLNTLLDLGYDDIDEAINLALNDEDASVRMNALSKVTNLDLPASETVAFIETVMENGTTEELKTALSTLARIEGPSSQEALDRQMDLLINGTLPQEVHLDLLLAVESKDSDQLQDKLDIYKSAKPQDDPVSPYIETLYGGNAENGQRLINNHEGAQCMRCHAMGGEGSDVGPDLEQVGARLTRELILESLVNPSAQITPGYGFVTLTLQNGETVQGELNAETDTHITVGRGDNKNIIEKSEIFDRTHSPSSMPAMGNILSRSELRDLIEFLSPAKI
ncbi:MAG: HEAT repeat domain-containing protein [Balneolales bacterium]